MSDERATHTNPDVPDAGEGPSDPPPEPRRRLTRSRHDKVVAGVAGGLGDYFSVDPIIFRIGFVAVTLLGGSGILLYVVAWLVMPLEGESASAGRKAVQHTTSPSVIGVALLLIAALFLARETIDVGIGRFTAAVLLVAAGAALLLRASDRGSDDTDPDDTGPDEPDDTDDTDVLESDEPDLPDSEEPEADDPDDEGGGFGAFGRGWPAWRRRVSGTDVNEPAAAATPPPPTPPAPPAPPAPPESTPPPEKRRKPRSRLGRITVSILLILGGLAAFADGIELFDVTVDGFVAVALIVVGLALVLGAWWGRSRWLIAVGLLFTAFLGFLSAVDVPLDGGFGERNVDPATLADLESPYRLFAGEMVVDVSGLEFPRGTTRLEASVVFGQLEVFVPRDVTVVVEAEVDAGNIELFGRQADHGVGSHVRRTVRGTGEGTVLSLDLNVGAGEIGVDHGTP